MNKGIIIAFIIASALLAFNGAQLHSTSKQIAELVGNVQNAPLGELPLRIQDTSLANVSSTNVTTSSTKVLNNKGGRQFFILTNDSDTNIYCALGATAEVNKGFRLNLGGGSYTADFVFPGVVNCIHGGTGNKVMTTQEL